MLSIEMQESVYSTDDNLIISPYSIINILALLAQGANGNTYEQLRQELHLYGNRWSVAEQFHILSKLLQKCAGDGTFLTANQIYVQQGHPINRNFQKVATQKFSSDIKSVNFANSIETAGIINHFVEKKTNGKITNLVTPDTLSANTGAVLVNAIYFKANWKYQFNKEDTIKDYFYTHETETALVDFMSITGEFNYAYLRDLDATALEMKYANSDFSFIIILPNKRNGLSKLEEKLKRYNLATVTDQMNLEEVDVEIPKFKIAFEVNLNEILRNVSI